MASATPSPDRTAVSRRCITSGAASAALLVMGLAVACTTGAGSDLERHVARREACDHFRGEEPYDAERAAFLASQIEASCANIDAESAVLRRKYRHDPRAIARLSRAVTPSD